MSPSSLIRLQSAGGMLALASSTLDCTRLGFVVLRATATIWGKRKLNCTHTAAGETPNSPQSAVNLQLLAPRRKGVGPALAGRAGRR